MECLENQTTSASVNETGFCAALQGPRSWYFLSAVPAALAPAVPPGPWAWRAATWPAYNQQSTSPRTAAKYCLRGGRWSRHRRGCCSITQAPPVTPLLHNTMLRAINTSASRQGSICCQKLIKTDCTFGGTYFTKHVSLVSKSVLNCPDNSLSRGGQPLDARGGGVSQARHRDISFRRNACGFVTSIDRV